MSKPQKKRTSSRLRKKTQRSNLLTLLVLVAILSGLLIIVVSKVTENINQSRSSNYTAPDTTKEDFIARLAPTARQLHEKHQVLPSIILGQAILESDWGRSELAATYHNLFGVKNYVEGAGVILKTKEFVNEEWIEISGDFRVYDSWEDSMEDHSLLFVHGVSWNPEIYHKVLAAADYHEAASELQDAGYATDPDYAKKIINVIESYDLARFD